MRPPRRARGTRGVRASIEVLVGPANSRKRSSSSIDRLRCSSAGSGSPTRPPEAVCRARFRPRDTSAAERRIWRLLTADVLPERVGVSCGLPSRHLVRLARRATGDEDDGAVLLGDRAAPDLPVADEDDASRRDRVLAAVELEPRRAAEDDVELLVLACRGAELVVLLDHALAGVRAVGVHSKAPTSRSRRRRNQRASSAPRCGGSSSRCVTWNFSLTTASSAPRGRPGRSPRPRRAAPRGSRCRPSGKGRRRARPRAPAAPDAAQLGAELVVHLTTSPRRLSEERDVQPVRPIQSSSSGRSWSSTRRSKTTSKRPA